VGVIPFLYRLEHRDGRDRYQFLFITVTWTRGGNLPAKLEMMVRPEIPGFASMQANDILTYTNGFVPAFGPLQTPPQQPQQITVPGQSVAATADPLGNMGTDNGNFPTLLPPAAGQQRREEFEPFGVKISGRQFLTAKDKESAWDARDLVEFADSPEAARDGFIVPIDASVASFVCRMESVKPFEVKLRYTGGEQSMDVIRTSENGYVCVVYGTSINFLKKEIELVVTQDDSQRTIKFFEK
jgi:hypothetical protein